jgi:hypothetical protein
MTPIDSAVYAPQNNTDPRILQQKILAEKKLSDQARVPGTDPVSKNSGDDDPFEEIAR